MEDERDPEMEQRAIAQYRSVVTRIAAQMERAMLLRHDADISLMAVFKMLPIGTAVVFQDESRPEHQIGNVAGVDVGKQEGDPVRYRIATQYGVHYADLNKVKASIGVN